MPTVYPNCEVGSGLGRLTVMESVKVYGGDANRFVDSLCQYQPKQSANNIPQSAAPSSTWKSCYGLCLFSGSLDARLVALLLPGFEVFPVRLRGSRQTNRAASRET